MRRQTRREVHRADGYEMHIIGVRRPGLRDLYHALLRVPWWAALGTIVGAYLLLNALFACLYLVTGGVHGAAPHSAADAFFFSVQTMGTIGYGSMYPETRAANALVVAESVTGLVVTALATGLVFARFSQTRARVVFSERVAIAPLDGVPTLMIRVGNERRGRIVGAVFTLTLMRSVRSAEGVTLFRSVDVPLVRARAPALSRSWNVLHRIDRDSPLFGETPGSLAEKEAELTLEVFGTDDTTLQAVHASNVWSDRSFAWGARLADVITETPEGNLELDVRRFHEVTPTEPTADFPYPAAP